MTTLVDLSDPPRRSPYWRIAAAWLVVALAYAAIVRAQVGVPFASALENAVVNYGVLAWLMVPVAAWTRRTGADRRPAARTLLTHIAIGVFVVSVWQGANLLYFRSRIGPRYWDFVYAQSWMFQLMTAVITYAAVLGITLTFQANARERERERREAELLIVARDAELAAIKAQLQPHFFLNALTSLLVLIEKDPAQARVMVMRLAELMQSILAGADLERVPLGREIELTKAYLDIESIRFGSRLTVAFDIDPAARDVLVPAFLLQPLVENAVKHGIAPHASAGAVTVSAVLTDGRVSLVVRDAGDERSQAGAGPHPAGRGLQLTRRRLETAYGNAFTLSMDRGPNGCTVRVDLPATDPSNYPAPTRVAPAAVTRAG